MDSSNNKLRACLNCAILQSTNDFKQNGCPNCPFLNTNKERNLNYTTSLSFKGMIAVKRPRNSWVCKWHRINNYLPGLYASVVEGVLGDRFIESVERDGRLYINRSKSFELE
jgi:transcription elongation factor SPT4